MVINGLAHKASQAAIDGFALWASPQWASCLQQNWTDCSAQTPQQPPANSSDAARAGAIRTRTCASIPIPIAATEAVREAVRIVAAAGLLLPLPMLWRSLGSLHDNSLALHPDPKHPHPNN